MHGHEGAAAVVDVEDPHVRAAQERAAGRGGGVARELERRRAAGGGLALAAQGERVGDGQVAACHRRAIGVCGGGGIDGGCRLLQGGY